MSVFRPGDAAEAQEIVAWAAGENQSVEIVGGGSKRALGRPPVAEHTLDVSGLAGIIDYDPPELVLTARAATPMKLIESELAARRQILAFEPPDWRALLGAVGEPTLGGVIACNMAGPRRVRAGAARDHFLGFSAINGFGDAWKAGGRVVKNVTGYDMCKLQVGAYGTLSVLTELSVRVLPRPETAATLVVRGLAEAAAVRLLSQALNTPHEVSAAAHLPQAAGGALTALRLEGPPPSVAFRIAALEEIVGRGDRLDYAETDRLWRDVGAVAPLLPSGPRNVWRLCPTPAAAADLTRAIRAKLSSAEFFYDWGGGLVWLSVDPAEAGSDGGAGVVRAAMRRVGGHAMLVVAPVAVRASVPVFEPLAGPLAALSGRVKNGFDPRAILNPGRMQEGQ